MLDTAATARNGPGGGAGGDGLEAPPPLPVLKGGMQCHEVESLVASRDGTDGGKEYSVHWKGCASHVFQVTVISEVTLHKSLARLAMSDPLVYELIDIPF